LEDVARKFPVKDAALIRSWADAKKALASGYGIAVCSNQGFEDRDGRVGTRDANGVCRPYGTWQHCMCLDGYHTADDGREYGHIENSWGPDAHRGPVGWGEPSTAGFWAASPVLDGMIRQGESWAFSGAVGFPRKRLPDWFIRATPAPARPIDLFAHRLSTFGGPVPGYSSAP